MFRVITTGKNECFGKKGEERNLGDDYVLNCLKEGWITADIKYLGNARKSMRADMIKPKEKLGLPINYKRVDYLLESILLAVKNNQKNFEKNIELINRKYDLIKTLIEEHKGVDIDVEN